MLVEALGEKTERMASIIFRQTLFVLRIAIRDTSSCSISHLDSMVVMAGIVSQKQASLPPTWIAAIMGDDVVELDGDLIDYTKAGPHLPSIMRQGASFDYDFDDEFWSASPWDELFAFREFPRKPEDSI